MALHNLKITVVDGGKVGAGVFSDKSSTESAGEKTPDGKNSTLYKILNYNKTIKGKIKQAMSPTAFFAVEQGVGLATQIGKEVINYFVGDIGRASGDSNYQAVVSRKIEIATDFMSVGQGILNGAAAGSMAGPIGAAIGAVIGAASSGVSLGFKYAERERTYQHEMFKENTSQAYQLSRANYTVATGRAR